MFICPCCGSNDVQQENVEMTDTSVSRIDYECLMCGWSQSSLSIVARHMLYPLGILWSYGMNIAYLSAKRKEKNFKINNACYVIMRHC